MSVDDWFTDVYGKRIELDSSQVDQNLFHHKSNFSLALEILVKFYSLSMAQMHRTAKLDVWTDLKFSWISLLNVFFRLVFTLHGFQIWWNARRTCSFKFKALSLKVFLRVLQKSLSCTLSSWLLTWVLARRTFREMLSEADASTQSSILKWNRCVSITKVNLYLKYFLMNKNVLLILQKR